MIIRSDSGDPVQVVVKTLEILMQKFGFEVNKKEYKVLPKYIRVLHGDRVSIEKIVEILEVLKVKKISGKNISFGMGASLLQKVNRDNQQFAMKLSAIKKKNCDWEGVCKSPITEPIKHSKCGRLSLVRRNNVFHTIKYELNLRERNYLIPVFKNGEILNEVTFSQIQNNIIQYSS